MRFVRQSPRRLDISPSYLNLIENNRRPLPAPLLVRIAQLFNVELHLFAADEDSRLASALFEALADPLFESQDVLATEARELVVTSPSIARALLNLFRSYQQAKDSAENLSAQLFEGEQQTDVEVSHVSSEEAGDLMQQHMNYIPELEQAAEELWRVAELGLGCPISRAQELVYSDGIDLDNLDAFVPVGVTCRICERTNCEQRAFPSLRHPLRIDENVRGVSLYATVDARPKLQ